VAGGGAALEFREEGEAGSVRQVHKRLRSWIDRCEREGHTILRGAGAGRR